MRRTRQLKVALRFLWRLDFLRMAVLWPWTLLFSYLQIMPLPWRSSRNFISHRRRSVSRTSSTRPLCIITGATSGLGAEAAYNLSMEGFYVVLVGRSLKLLYKTMNEIETRNKDAHLNAFRVDMSSLHSILEFKNSLEKWLLDSDMHYSVQLLINNAGMLGTSYRLTAEGYDKMMATNYIGAFSLTKLLLPLLKNSPTPSRIVNVTSFTHRNVSSVQVNKDDVSGNCFLRSQKYPCARVYEYSKFCLLLFSYELHRQLGLEEESRKVSVVAADPGFVKTRIMREVPFYISRMAFLAFKLLGLLQSPENGISSIIDAALAPPEISGVYFFGGKGRAIKSSELSYNSRIAQELWTVSSDLILQSQLAIKNLTDSWCGPIRPYEPLHHYL